MFAKIKILFMLLFITGTSWAQTAAPAVWHNEAREIRYHPDGEDFVIVNGSRRFNRALYGGNTAFRVEAGDLPEFAQYLPGMGGNLQFALMANDTAKWLIRAKSITARYRPGSMIYDISDPILQQGAIRITVLPLYDGEGMVVKIEHNNVPQQVKLMAAFGGVSGTKFSRDGDIGADPESSFYLKPEYCANNVYTITSQNAFSLRYGAAKPLTEAERYEVRHLPSQHTDVTKKAGGEKICSGIFPLSAQLKLADPAQQGDPLQYFHSTKTTAAALAAQMAFTKNEVLYFYLSNGPLTNSIAYQNLPALFNREEAARKQLAGRIKIHTPDPYINPMGGALGMAADAIWEDPSYLHGAVAWRMRLNAWRGAYVADAFGWHNRARMHFSSYALSQLTSPATGPVVADTALHLARQLEKLGTSLFSSGYICRNPNGDFRPHHYDMNLVFIDELLNHFNWTGDLKYVKAMWPLLTRHLAWEKRNFDADGDGLYDAYAAIWASDALQYSGGGVTHSSAYNYRANNMAAELAPLIGEDPAPYRREADKILTAINSRLWMPSKGWYAEYKDLLGLQQLHPAAGIWTVYHALDEHIADPFQMYQSLRYIDNNIPHIPIRANGLADTTLYTISTTNWQPYTWSINNVALAEILHTALAYWQGGRQEEAYKLWKGGLIESMYLGASPGNVQQLSFYDAIRAELYRDFADPIGIAARSVVEGLFGVVPDAISDTLHVTPGLPAGWAFASLSTPDFSFDFNRESNNDRYTLQTHFPKAMQLVFSIKAKSDDVESVIVNGKPAPWRAEEKAIGVPALTIVAPARSEYVIDIKWKGRPFEKVVMPPSYARGEALALNVRQAVIMKVYDPQQVLTGVARSSGKVTGTINTGDGNKTFFVQLQQGKFNWWMPVDFRATAPVEIFNKATTGTNESIAIQNNTATAITGTPTVNGVSFRGMQVSVESHGSAAIAIPGEALVAGTNLLQLMAGNRVLAETQITNWNVNNRAESRYEKIILAPYFNDDVTSIFTNRYLSPRPVSPTLQLPAQGIGNWCYPLTMANINDSGLRARAGNNNEIIIRQGIPFATPSSVIQKNIVYTSLWDNYPDSVVVALTGKASHAYLLMAGSTNPMQSRFTNGVVVVRYTDGTLATLALKNPETWWPIEQDYYEDGYAFTTDHPKPVRVYLKSGIDSRTYDQYTVIKGFTNMGIDGGAATVLDLPLDAGRELESLTVRTLANDVVIGLMSITLVRSLNH